MSIRASAEAVRAAYMPGHTFEDQSFGPIASGIVDRPLQIALERLLVALWRLEAADVAENEETAVGAVSGDSRG